MSDPTRWRDDPAGFPVGADVLLRGARRPRPPRPDEEARMDAAINRIARQSSFSSRRWSPMAVAAAAAVTIAGLGTGAWAWRAARRDAGERETIAAATGTNARMPKPRAAEPGPPELEPSEAPALAHKAVARPDARAVRPPRRDRPAPVVAAAGPVTATDTLVWETALVDAARRDLAAAPAHALASLETHRREFRHGQLAAEREFLAVEVLRRLGRSNEARQRATELQAHYPNSSYAKRAARLLDAAPGNPPTTP